MKPQLLFLSSLLISSLTYSETPFSSSGYEICENSVLCYPSLLCEIKKDSLKPNGWHEFFLLILKDDQIEITNIKDGTSFLAAVETKDMFLRYGRLRDVVISPIGAGPFERMDLSYRFLRENYSSRGPHEVIIEPIHGTIRKFNHSWANLPQEADATCYGGERLNHLTLEGTEVVID